MEKIYFPNNEAELGRTRTSQQCLTDYLGVPRRTLSSWLIRRGLTDVIQDTPNHNKWDFKHYTNLAYKTTIEKNAAQLRKELHAPKKSKAVDYMRCCNKAAMTIHSAVGNGYGLPAN